jgi:hypothetical protein
MQDNGLNISPNAIHRSYSSAWWALAGGLLLTAAMWMLAACQSNRPEIDIYSAYRPAVKEHFYADFAKLDQAPRYDIDLTIAQDSSALTGTVRVNVTNYSQDPWRALVFRLYPAMRQFGGTMSVRSALVNRQPVAFVYQAENTAVRLELTEPLLPGQQAIATISYGLDIPQWSDDPGVYALFGRSQHMTTLPLFYPSLAVYQDGPTIGSGRWWLEIGSARGDAAFNVASLFAVTATVAAEQVVVSSGTLVSSERLGAGDGLIPMDGDEVADGNEGGAGNEDGSVGEEPRVLPIAMQRMRYRWVTGPTREFALHMSPIFQSDSVEAYGTRVTSYWLPGQEAAGRAALKYGVAALRIYSDYFGEYPFHDLRLAPAPLSYRGMEYPQLLLIGVELYTRFQSSLELLVAHEVAHQWWYLIVHNDPVNMPWLDEGLAEYSVKLYYEGLRGESVAGGLQRQRWQTPLALLAERDAIVALDRPVDSFESGSQYETVVYGRGALLYDNLRRILGDRPFRRFLREYLQNHRYQIVDTEMWREAILALEEPEAERLYQEWVAAPDLRAATVEEESTPAPGRDAVGASILPTVTPEPQAPESEESAAESP